MLVASLVAWVAITGKTGTAVGPTTPPLLWITLVSGAVCALAALRAPVAGRPWGAGTILGAVALLVVTGLSIGWSVSPDESWFETNRLVAYVAVLAAGASAAHLAPGRWQAPLGGVLLGLTAVVVVAALGKVFPAWLSTDSFYARLQDPVGYWNAMGAIAAIVVVLSLWLGTRREGYRPLNALAYPIAGVAVLVLLLTYSRGSLVAAGLGTAAWMLFSPRRLHSLLILAVGGLGGAFVAVWAFASNDLSTNDVVLSARESAGAELGLLLGATVVLLLAVGLAVEFATVFAGMRTDDRRRLGVVVACILAIVPIAGVGLLATSERGLTGSISRAYDQVTNPQAAAPSSDPSRLGAVSSTRSLYWRQAFDLFEKQKLHGVGAGGFGEVQSRVRKDPFVAKHAHGFVPQTLADLGLLGLAASLLFAGAWIVAAVRGLGLRGPLRLGARRPERDGTAVAVAVVVTFFATAVADWTWSIPAVTIPVLLLVGWVAGRGAQAAFTAAKAGPVRLASPRTALAVAVVVLTGIAAVSLVQPWRSVRAQADALTSDDLGRAEARAKDARSLNPLSVDADYALASVYVRQGREDQARGMYQAAIRLEPGVPETWTRLARFELSVADRPTKALQAAGVALRLAPTDQSARLVAVAANRRAIAKRAARAAAKGGGSSRAAASTTGAAAPSSGAASSSGTASSSGAASSSGTTSSPGAANAPAPAAGATPKATPSITTSTTPAVPAATERTQPGQ